MNASFLSGLAHRLVERLWPGLEPFGRMVIGTVIAVLAFLVVLAVVVVLPQVTE